MSIARRTLAKMAEVRTRRYQNPTGMKVGSDQGSGKIFQAKLTRLMLAHRAIFDR